jgi:hypothetical protein
LLREAKNAQTKESAEARGCQDFLWVDLAKNQRAVCSTKTKVIFNGVAHLEITRCVGAVV